MRIKDKMTTQFMNKIHLKELVQAGIIGCFAAMVTTSCQFEDDDFFDKSASLRVEKTNTELKDLLPKPANGWVMQYFTGTGVAHFEGFNLFAKFESDMKVTMAGNHRLLRNGNAGKYTEHKSLYSLLLEDSPVLAFNTWNDILTPLVDPVDPYKAPNMLLKDGAGMQGDNNFVIVRYNENEVIMRGERYSAEVRLVVCDRDWKQYISDCNDMKKLICGKISSYYIMNDSESLYLTGIAGGRVRKSERLEDPIRRDSLACVFTPNGIRFEKKDSLGKNAFQEFKLTADKTQLLNEDGSVKIVPTWDEYLMTYSGVLTLDESRFSAAQNAVFNNINNEVKKFNNTWSLKSIGLGRGAGANANNGIIFTFYTNKAKTSDVKAYMELKQERISLGKIAISQSDNPECDNNLTTIASKASGIINYCKQMASTLKGKYDVVPNDYFSPTGATYTAYEGGQTFVLK